MYFHTLEFLFLPLVEFLTTVHLYPASSPRIFTKRPFVEIDLKTRQSTVFLVIEYPVISIFISWHPTTHFFIRIKFIRISGWDFVKDLEYRWNTLRLNLKVLLNNNRPYAQIALGSNRCLWRTNLWKGRFNYAILLFVLFFA